MAKFTDCEGNTRRDFIKIGAAGLCGLSLPQLLRLESQAQASSRNTREQRRPTSVIVLWLAGGPATIDMWDLKPDAPSTIRGEFNPANTNVSGIQISQHLPQMGRVMNHCTIIRSLAHTIPSHAVATEFMNTGNRPTPAVNFPSLGSLVSRLRPAEGPVPPYVAFGGLRAGGNGGYLGTGYNPFSVNARGNRIDVQGISLPTGFTLEQLNNRNRLFQTFDSSFRAADRSSDLADGMDAFHRRALEILRSSETRDAFNLASEPQNLRTRYGTDPVGQGMLAARRLTEAGVRFVTVGLGGWDTHRNNWQSLRTRLLPRVDQALSALIEDLAQRGRLEDTVVYCAGEFGRTPRINRNGGRDHWARSMSLLVAGGRFQRGLAYGTTDANGMAPANMPCTPDDFASTLFSSMGLDPHQELVTPSGRPMQLFREGRVIEGVLA